MTQTQFDNALLALTLWQLQANAQAMIAVGCVLRNRKTATKDSWGRVLAENTDDGSIDTKKLPDPRDPTWLETLRIVDGIVDGSTADLTGGAMFYCDQSRPIEDWFQTNVIDDKILHPYCARIGYYSFFR